MPNIHDHSWVVSTSSDMMCLCRRIGHFLVWNQATLSFRSFNQPCHQLLYVSEMKRHVAPRQRMVRTLNIHVLIVYRNTRLWPMHVSFSSTSPVTLHDNIKDHLNVPVENMMIILNTRGTKRQVRMMMCMDMRGILTTNWSDFFKAVGIKNISYASLPSRLKGGNHWHYLYVLKGYGTKSQVHCLCKNHFVVTYLTNYSH